MYMQNEIVDSNSNNVGADTADNTRIFLFELIMIQVVGPNSASKIKSDKDGNENNDNNMDNTNGSEKDGTKEDNNNTDGNELNGDNKGGSLKKDS